MLGSHPSRPLGICSCVHMWAYVHVLWRAWERHTGYLVLDALAFVRGPWMLVQFINPTHIILKTSAHQETLNPTALDCRSGKWFFLIFIQMQLIKWSPAPCGVCITLTPWVTVESGRDTSLFWTWSLTISAPSDGYEPHKNHTGRGLRGTLAGKVDRHDGFPETLSAESPGARDQCTGANTHLVHSRMQWGAGSIQQNVVGNIIYPIYWRKKEETLHGEKWWGNHFVK